MQKTQTKHAIEKRVVSMREQGRTFREIADSLGISVTKAHVVLARSGAFMVQRKSGNAQRDKQIISLRRKGYTILEIAETVGVSCATVHYVLTVLGGFPVRPGISKRTTNRILTMSAKGASLREIGAAVGLDFGTVGRLVRRHRDGLD